MFQLSHVKVTKQNPTNNLVIAHIKPKYTKYELQQE